MDKWASINSVEDSCSFQLGLSLQIMHYELQEQEGTYAAGIFMITACASEYVSQA